MIIAVANLWSKNASIGIFSRTGFASLKMAQWFATESKLRHQVNRPEEAHFGALTKRYWSFQASVRVHSEEWYRASSFSRLRHIWLWRKKWMNGPVYHSWSTCLVGIVAIRREQVLGSWEIEACHCLEGSLLACCAILEYPSGKGSLIITSLIWLWLIYRFSSDIFLYDIQCHKLYRCGM
jgi:hypothetical protein